MPGGKGGRGEWGQGVWREGGREGRTKSVHVEGDEMLTVESVDTKHWLRLVASSHEQHSMYLCQLTGIYLHKGRHQICTIINILMAQNMSYMYNMYMYMF